MTPFMVLLAYLNYVYGRFIVVLRLAKIQFYLFLIMTPLMVLIAYLNYMSGSYVSLGINIFTICLCFLNICQSRKNIKRIVQNEKDYIWKTLGGEIK